jgi:hypothetical protein
MGWEERSGRRYYYRKERIGGRVVSRCEGPESNPITHGWAELLRLKRAHASTLRAVARVEREDLDAADEEVSGWYDLVGALTRFALESAGYHRHDRGRWRKRRMSESTELLPATLPADPTDAELLGVIARARKDDRSALAALLPIAEADPDRLIRLGRGDLAAVAEEHHLRRNLKDDPLGRVAVALQMDRLRAELAGPYPSPIERLLADRCVLCWYHVQMLEMCEAKQATLSGSRRVVDQLDRAHRRYLQALKALAQVRKLALPTVQVNIGAQQVNVANGQR